MAFKSIEEKRAYHREYNRLRRQRMPGVDREACRRWRQKNLEYDLERQRAYREANPERRKASLADWLARNPDYHREWRAANPVKRKMYLAGYRGRKANATPLWADPDAIGAVYSEAERLTRETGIPHEVDHVIPLGGKTVCGLHVQGNLKAIPASMNRAKGNSFTD